MYGAELYYTESGTGFPLILLHGNGEDCGYFKNQIPFFSEKYRVIAVDTRGHGKSPRGTAPFSINQFSEDLKAFLDGMKIDKAHILGFSDGANIAMRFAMKYPGNVGKLILNGGNLDARGVKRRYQIPIEIGYRIAKLFSGKSPDALKNSEFLGLMVNDPDILPEELTKITAETLVIVGSRDMIKEKHTQLIQNKISDSYLSVINGNHFIAAENPDDFNREVMRFLDK